VKHSGRDGKIQRYTGEFKAQAMQLAKSFGSAKKAAK
jgi:hypothetical protein